MANLSPGETDLQQFLRNEYTNYYFSVRLLPVLPENSGRKGLVDDLYVPTKKRIVKSYNRLKKKRRRQRTYVTVLDDVLQDSQSLHRIFICGEAGAGKTILCRKLLSTWCKIKPDEFCVPKENDTDTEPMSLNENQDNEDVRMDTLRMFPFVFFVSLRNVAEEKTIEEMVIQQLLEGKYESEFYDVIKTRPTQCMFIIDGLDEWYHPEAESITGVNAVPGHTLESLILYTTRPWKMADVRETSGPLDVEIELTGFSTTLAERLVSNIIENMNRLGGKKKSMEDFRRNCPFSSCLRNPMLLKYLTCVWHDTSKWNESLTDLYCDIIEWNLQQVCEVEETEHEEIEPEIPYFQNNRKNVRKFWKLFLKLAELSFKNFGKQTDVTDAELKELGVTDTELSICYKFGLRCHHDCNVRSEEKQEQSISCIHKSFHDLCVAIYISKDPERVKMLFQSHRFDALSFVLQFACGFNETVLGIIAGEIYDSQIDEYPDDILQRAMWTRKRRQEQARLNACINEAKAVGHSLKQAIPLKFLFLKNGEDTKVVDYIRPEMVKNLFVWTNISDRIKSRVLSMNALHLLDMCLTQEIRSETDVDIYFKGNKIVGPLVEKQNHLTTLILSDMDLSHSQMLIILCNHKHMTRVELANVNCVEDNNCPCKNTASMYGSYNSERRTDIKHLDVYQSEDALKHITSAPSLEQVYLRNISGSYLDTFVSILRTCNSIKTIYLCDVCVDYAANTEELNRPETRSFSENQTLSGTTLTVINSQISHSQVTDILCSLPVAFKAMFSNVKCLNDEQCGCLCQSTEDFDRNDALHHCNLVGLELIASSGVLCHISETESLQHVRIKNIQSEDSSAVIRLLSNSKNAESLSVINASMSYETMKCCIDMQLKQKIFKEATVNSSSFIYTATHEDWQAQNATCSDFENEDGVIKKWTIPFNVLDAYDYSCKHTESLCVEYFDLLTAIKVKDPLILQMCRHRLYKQVNVYATGKLASAVANRLHERLSECAVGNESMSLENASHKIKHEAKNREPIIILVCTDELESFDKLVDSNTLIETLVLLVEDSPEKAESSLPSILMLKQSKVGIATEDNVHEEINNLLERYVFEIIHTLASHLQHLYSAPGLVAERMNSKESTTLSVLNYATILRSRRIELCFLPDMTSLANFNTYIQLLKDMLPYKTMLTERVRKLYERSRLPEYERERIDTPDCCSQPVEVNQAMIQSLMKLPNVTDCGERHKTLYVHLQPEPDGTFNDMPVKQVLGSTNHIVRYITESFRPLYRPGVTIPIPNISYATLGGFAKDSERLYALFSKHVAQILLGMGIKQLNLGQNVKGEICEPLERGDSPLDIALAQIVQNRDGVEVVFKDETGRPRRCILLDTYIGNPDCPEIVHIWGGTSKPGLGEIDLTSFKNQKSYNLFTLKDRRRLFDSVRPFCQGGDSGSIILGKDTEGHLLAIGMLMGKVMSRDEHKQEEVSIYTALVLKAGLHQLSQIHDIELQFCNGSGR